MDLPPVLNLARDCASVLLSTAIDFVTVADFTSTVFSSLGLGSLLPNLHPQINTAKKTAKGSFRRV